MSQEGMSPKQRAEQIVAAGASRHEVEELLVYNESAFDPTESRLLAELPLPDEPFASTWRAWADEAGQNSRAFETLQRYLPQLRFPIQEGISQTPAYRAATLQGRDPDEFEEATGLVIDAPGTVELAIYPSLAGHIPIITLSGRPQFKAFVRALTNRNEPVAVPDSMGAKMIGGFNNWCRIRALQAEWVSNSEPERETWKEEFAYIRQRKKLYQDRFILLSDGPYSAVEADEMGLDEEIWRQKSLIIRREHECTHYFTRRIFGSMRNNLLDELIADYAGIVAAEGHYRSDWFLRFIGLEHFPSYHPGRRLDLYRGDPPLSDGAFRVLQQLIVRAARQLEVFDREHVADKRSPRMQALVLAALATLRVDELASEAGSAMLAESLRRLDQSVSVEDR